MLLRIVKTIYEHNNYRIIVCFFLLYYYCFVKHNFNIVLTVIPQFNLKFYSLCYCQHHPVIMLRENQRVAGQFLKLQVQLLLLLIGLSHMFRFVIHALKLYLLIDIIIFLSWYTLYVCGLDSNG